MRQLVLVLAVMLATPMAASTPRPIAGLEGYGHVVADVNGDGLDDFVFGRGKAVLVALGDGAGGFTVETLTARPIGLVTLGAALGEIAVVDEANTPGRLVEVFRRAAGGQWYLARTVVEAPEAIAVRLADLDRDGAAEVLVVEKNLLGGRIPLPNDYRLKVFSGSTGELLLAREYGDVGFDLAVDHAGVVLAVRGARRGGYVEILPAGALAAPATIAIKTDPRGPSTADFNGDGRRDIAYIDAEVLVVQYGNAGGYGAATAVAPVGPWRNSTVASDLDGDGFTDLLVHGGLFTLFRGSPAGLVAVPLCRGYDAVPARLRAGAPPTLVAFRNGGVEEIDITCAARRRRGAHH